MTIWEAINAELERLKKYEPYTDGSWARSEANKLRDALGKAAIELAATLEEDK
jgi:hypothetical protein